MRYLIPVFCLLLAGCGFSPVYGSHGRNEPVSEALNSVSVANIPDRQGQVLRNHLIDRMYFKGRPEKPASALEVTLRSNEYDLGIQKDATASRRVLNLWADYVLRANDGKELIKGKAHSSVSYSKLEAQYGTLAAKENAQKRAINEVGEQIVNRLSVYFAEKPERAEPEKPEKPKTKKPGKIKKEKISASR